MNPKGLKEQAKKKESSKGDMLSEVKNGNVALW